MDGSTPLDLGVLLAQAGRVRRLALHLARDPDQADDLVQETWRRALEHPVDPGTSESGLRAWLARVMRNLATDRSRDARLRAWHERSASRPEPWSPADVEERVELQRRLAEAVLGLEEPYRSAITLRYFEELSPREIARRQRISYAAARQRISRGLAMLRARLDREHGGGRGAWCAALVSLVGRPRSRHPLSPLLPGGVIMGVNIKLLAGAAAVLAGVSFLAWRAVRVERGPPAEELAAGAEAPALSRDSARPAGEAAPSPGLSREAVTGGVPATGAQAGIDRDHDLHGEVTDPDGRPVAGATIDVCRWESAGYHSIDYDHPSHRRTAASTTTDAEGEFAVSLPIGRPFELEVRAAGFAPAGLHDRYAGEHVSVRLHRGCALSVRVTRASDKTAVEGATVKRGSGRFLVFEGTTDALGRCRFENLAPGKLGVDVIPRFGLAPARRLIDLRESESIELEVSLKEGATLRGRVVDAASGAPIANAEVGEGWWVGRSVRTGADGEYVLAGFPVDRYDLWVRAVGYGRQERIPFLLSTDPVPERIDFELQPVRAARGRVLDERGMPVEKVYVAAVANEPRPRPQRIDWIADTTAADGSFHLQGLRPDMPHALVARKEGFGTVAYDFPENEKESPSIDLGDLVLPPMSTLRGTVVDEEGHGLPDLEVALHGANADRSRLSPTQPPAIGLESFTSVRTGRTDDLGRFSFADLAAGSYTVKTRMKGADLNRSIEQPVVVPKGEEVSGVRLVVRRGASIEGRVVDFQGRPVPRAWLVVSAEGGDEGSTNCTADGEGRFAAIGLGPGVYGIEATPVDWGDLLPKPVSRLARTSVSGIEAGRKDVEIVMRRALVLRGRVIDALGQPVAGVFVCARAKGGQTREDGLTDTAGRFAIDVAEGDVLELEARPPLPSEHVNIPSVPDEDPTHFGHVSGVVPGDEEVVIRLPEYGV